MLETIASIFLIFIMVIVGISFFGGLYFLYKIFTK